MSIFRIFILLTIIVSLSCTNSFVTTDLSISSPSGLNRVQIGLNKNGAPYYSVYHKDLTIIDTSYLGFEIEELMDYDKEFEILHVKQRSYTENWELPWGETSTVKNNFNELTVELSRKAGTEVILSLIFRAFDDGIAFRYHFPAQNGFDTIRILNEKSEFHLKEDYTCWWIPGDWDIYEHLYTRSKLSEIDATTKRAHPNLAQTFIPENAVNTPFTLRSNAGLHLSFHEANLTDYAGMTLSVDTSNLKLTSALVGSENHSYKVIRSLPFSTPWRTVQIADKAGDLIESNLILNLNEPNSLGDVSWFSPMKYMGIWWEMHIGKSSWDMKSGRHGATTENAKKYIDFASANNIEGLLVEGWNTGWEHWIGFDEREGVFDFVTPYEDYDIAEVCRYAESKGMQIIMHHETSSAPRTYETQLDTAFALCEKLNIHAVKTGYVGKILPKGEYHHGQWMVRHYRKVLEKAAEYKIAVNAHEPIKDTGIRRTLPNAISREGLRGQEFNAWASDGGNPPNHIPTVAFTRMLAGPIDFTPGVFNLNLPEKPDNQINTTLAHQLALYVVLYSPVQMACDLPENYQGHPAFQFIRDVGVDWERTKVLAGEIGEFVVIARLERKTGTWFVGGITNEIERELNISLDFLNSGEEYVATIYQDGKQANFKTNPTNFEIVQAKVRSNSEFAVKLKSGGGFAISIEQLN